MAITEAELTNQNNNVIIENYNTIKKEIEAPELRPINENHSPHLIVVTKHHPIEAITPLLEIGHNDFGENKVQEAIGKWSGIKDKYPIKLHMIGALQTNKVADALKIFDVIQTVDREKLALTLAKEMNKLERNIPCYIQINTGEEEQKAGIFPLEADDFIEYCRNDLKLNIEGLMCIPPVDCNYALHFELLRKISKSHELSYLSMGMSDSYTQAIKSGATHIRVGTKIMGKRQF